MGIGERFEFEKTGRIDSEPAIKWAKVGDTIETTIQNPRLNVLLAILSTPEACAYGNELIASGRWKLSDSKNVPQ